MTQMAGRLTPERAIPVAEAVAAGRMAEEAGGRSAPASAPARPSAVKPGLKQLAIRGAAWTVGGYGASQVLRLGSNLILTRLLFPEAFGLMALVNVFLTGLQMFSDVGIGPALVRDKRQDESFVNTAWTMQALRGIALFAASCGLAWPLARLYDEPLLLQLIPVVGFTAALSGFQSTQLFHLRRELKVDPLVKLELIRQFVGIGTGVTWALVSPTVWALVASGIAGSAAHLVLSHTLLGGARNRFAWDDECRRRLISFGKWIFLSSAICFIAQQTDRLLLGKLVSAQLLGVYSIGLMLSQVPVTLNSQLVRQVLYPALSTVYRDRADEVSKKYYAARRMLDLLFLPSLGFLMVCGHLVVQVLYDDRYLAAGWMLQVLCLRGATRCLLEPAETVLVALGQPRYALQQHVGRLAWVMVAVPAGWYSAGLPGLVVAIALMELPAWALLWRGLAKERVLVVRREAWAIVFTLGGALVGLGALTMYSSVVT